MCFGFRGLHLGGDEREDSGDHLIGRRVVEHSGCGSHTSTTAFQS